MNGRQAFVESQLISFLIKLFSGKSELHDGVCSTFRKHIFPSFANNVELSNSKMDDSDEIELLLTYVIAPDFAYFFAINHGFIIQTIKNLLIQMRKF